jgi:DNA-binding MarR family transcriptional regulator
MTAHGLVTRWRSDTDGRAVLLSLTAEAETTADTGTAAGSAAR